MPVFSQYRSTLEKIFISVLLLIVFLLPMWGKAIPPLIAIACVVWFLHGNFKHKLAAVFRNPVLILFIVFYLFHLVGMLYTENIKTGLSHLEVKFSLLLFPLILGGMKGLLINNFNKIIRIFILGNLLASVICLARAAYYIMTSGENYFYYSDFSVFSLPTYSSVYILFSIAGIFYFLTSENSRFSSKMKWLFAGGILFFLVVVFLNSSRAAIISAIVAFGFTGAFYFVRRKKWLWLSVTVIIPVLIGVSLVMFNLRFEPIRRFVSGPVDSLSSSSSDNIAIRYMVAKQGLQLVKENFWTGTGTGDVKDGLMHKYASLNIVMAEHERLNAHNQFLETFIGLGIAGFLLLLLLVSEQLYSGVKQNNILKITFGLLIAVNFLFESMLNTQAGVIFYAFFGTLLVVCFSPGSYRLKNNS